jgi:hypothetical protein
VGLSRSTYLETILSGVILGAFGWWALGEPIIRWLARIITTIGRQ